MPTLNIKPTHKSIKTYYAELKEYERLGEQNEGTVRTAFQGLLQHYCHQSNLTLLCEKTRALPSDKGGQGGSNRRIRPDGEVVDTFKLPYGYWEAKDIQDDLHVEASKKFAAGYPSKNIVIQSPTHALLYQHGELQLDLDITEPRNLVRVLQGFFAYQEENIAAWHTAVAEFRDKVPELGAELAVLIEAERQNNPHFQEAFTRFHRQCRTSINPNLSVAAVEEMLIQHLLTERIFRTVFDNPDFTRRNIIAREIETVIDVLTERTLNRSEFLRLLEPFYTAIEQTASTITDFSQKQGFLNTVYEQFFQGFSVKVADTHGIVYTPQPIVDFMVKSIEHILETEFDRSLSDSGVNIIDPFVGAGNFIVRIMQELDPISLERKHTADPPELQCNEVMLLPYYIASLTEYDKLKFIQNPDVSLDWRVAKMRLSKDKTSLVYNDFLTLANIPEKAFDYRLGTRSALEWIVDQYRVKIDKRSGIVNDPNRADDPQYIVKLIGQVITVSLETVDIITGFPSLDLKISAQG